MNNRRDSSNGGHQVFAPVVQFNDSEGKSHVYESTLYASKYNKLKVGEEILVYFRASEPHYAHVGSMSSFFTFEIYAFALRVIMVSFGLYDHIN